MKNTNSKIDYGTATKESAELNEYMDCSVVAVSIACQIPYKEVHKAFEAQGRESRKRTPRHITMSVLDHFKIDYTLMLDWEYKGKKWSIQKGQKPGCSIGWVGQCFPKGNYIVFIRGHVAALVDGNLEDWTKGRRHSTLEVFRIENPHNSPKKKAPAKKAPAKKAPAKKAPAKKARIIKRAVKKPETKKV